MGGLFCVILVGPRGRPRLERERGGVKYYCLSASPVPISRLLGLDGGLLLLVGGLDRLECFATAAAEPRVGWIGVIATLMDADSGVGGQLLFLFFGCAMALPHGFFLFLLADGLLFVRFCLRCFAPLVDADTDGAADCGNGEWPYGGE